MIYARFVSELPSVFTHTCDPDQVTRFNADLDESFDAYYINAVGGEVRGMYGMYGTTTHADAKVYAIFIS